MAACFFHGNWLQPDLFRAQAELIHPLFAHLSKVYSKARIDRGSQSHTLGTSLNNTGKLAHWDEVAGLFSLTFHHQDA